VRTFAAELKVNFQPWLLIDTWFEI